jgi:hypothetical protein
MKPLFFLSNEANVWSCSLCLCEIDSWKLRIIAWNSAHVSLLLESQVARIIKSFRSFCNIKIRRMKSVRLSYCSSHFCPHDKNNTYRTQILSIKMKYGALQSKDRDRTRFAIFAENKDKTSTFICRVGFLFSTQHRSWLVTAEDIGQLAIETLLLSCQPGQAARYRRLLTGDSHLSSQQFKFQNSNFGTQNPEQL